MLYNEVQPIALAIMTSIITGGFVLVFIEVGNRKNRASDRYDRIMTPFMSKLSAFFRFINWSRSHIIYPKEKNDNEIQFKTLIDELSQYGTKLIMSGGDYGIDDFNAKQLYNVASKINNIWYFYDKMRPCRLAWNDYTSYDGTDFIAKELKRINPLYLTERDSVELISKVSGDFYIDIYQPIEYEMFKYVAHMKEYTIQTVLVAIFFAFDVMMLSLMLFLKLPVLVLQITAVSVVLMLIVALVILSIDVSHFVEYRAKRKKSKVKRRNKIERIKYKIANKKHRLIARLKAVMKH